MEVENARSDLTHGVQEMCLSSPPLKPRANTSSRTLSRSTVPGITAIPVTRMREILTEEYEKISAEGVNEEICELPTTLA